MERCAAAEGSEHLGNQLARRPLASPTADTILGGGLPPAHPAHMRVREDAMSHTYRPTPAAWVGIDVSQHTLDACLLPAPGADLRQ